MPCFPPRSPRGPAAESRVPLARCRSRGEPGVAGGRDLGRRELSSSAWATGGSEEPNKPRGSFRASFAVPQCATRQVEGRPAKQRPAHRERLRAVASTSSVPPVGEVASRRGRRVRWPPGEGPVRQRGAPRRRAVPAAAAGAHQVRRSVRLERTNGPPGKVLDAFDRSRAPRRASLVRVKLRSRHSA